MNGLEERRALKTFLPKAKLFPSSPFSTLNHLSKKSFSPR